MGLWFLRPQLPTAGIGRSQRPTITNDIDHRDWLLNSNSKPLQIPSSTTTTCESYNHGMSLETNLKRMETRAGMWEGGGAEGREEREGGGGVRVGGGTERREVTKGWGKYWLASTQRQTVIPSRRCSTVQSPAEGQQVVDWKRLGPWPFWNNTPSTVSSLWLTSYLILKSHNDSGHLYGAFSPATSRAWWAHRKMQSLCSYATHEIEQSN